MLISTPQLILDWSEVWALLIPLVVLFLQKRQPTFLKPITTYLWIAFALNLTCDIIGDFYIYFPAWLRSNNILYNIHSIVRFVCFVYFFHLVKQHGFSTLKKIIPLFFLLFFIINFTFYEAFNNPNQLSGNLLAAEAYLLLMYCMVFYLSKLKQDTSTFTTGKEFWIVTGLSFYVVINFFVFLFYNPMLAENIRLAITIWNVHNVAFIIFCIFIAKALHLPPVNKDYIEE